MTSRRSFLGIIGGALAAPKLAPSLTPPPATVPAAAGAFSGGTLLNDVVESDWRVTRVRHLKDLLAGRGQAAKEHAHHRRTAYLYQLENVERHRLDSLRSVSNQHKTMMFVKGSSTRQEAINRMVHENELESLLYQLGNRML